MDQERASHASRNNEQGWRRTPRRRFSSSDTDTILGQAGENFNTDSIEKFLSLCLQQFECRQRDSRDLKIDNIKVSEANIWLLFC